MSFARWYWNKINEGEKLLIVFISWVSICLILGIFVGSIAFLYFVTGVAMGAVGTGLYQLAGSIRRYFARYRRQYEEEQEELVRRLKRGGR